MILKELTNQEFKKFTDDYPIKSIYQSMEYGFVMNEENFDSVFLGLIESNEIIGAALVLIDKKNNKAFVPRGYLIDYNNKKALKTFTLELKSYLYKKNIISLIISPPIANNDNILKNLHHLKYQTIEYNNSIIGLKPKFEAVLNLELPYYELFKNIKKEFKTKIRSAEKNGIRVYKGSIDNLGYLYEQVKKKYPRNFEYLKNSYRFFSKSNKIDFFYTKLDTVNYLKMVSKRYEKQEELCKKIDEKLMTNKNLLDEKLSNDTLLNNYKHDLVKATKLLNNFPDGIVTSTVLIVKEKENVQVLIDGFDIRYKTFNSKHLLIWKLIEKYANAGYKTFNLGGINNPDHTTKKYQGLNEFKLSFNADIIEYIGDFELIINKPYNFIKNIFNKKKKT